MSPEHRLRTELIHSLCWIFHYSHKSYLWRDEINSRKLMLPQDIKRGDFFATSSDDSHLEMGELLGPLGMLAIEENNHDHSARLEFTFPEETLRAHLEASEQVADIDLDRFIIAFLREGSGFGASFRSSVDSTEAIASLPISQAAFKAPFHFQAVVSALCQSGFCAEIDGGYRWKEPIRPHMEAADLWIGDKTFKEVREAELTRIWQTMPSRLRALITESGDLDVLGLAMAMSHLWYGDKWHEKPESAANLQLAGDGLKGSHIATAKDIERLYSDGKLTN